MRFSPFYGALTLVIASPLYAQDATSSEEDVVVTATRTDGSRNDSPQVIKVITEKKSYANFYQNHFKANFQVSLF